MKKMKNTAVAGGPFIDSVALLDQLRLDKLSDEALNSVNFKYGR